MALEKIGVQAVIEGLSSFNRGMRSMKSDIIGVGDAAMTAEKRTETFNKTLKITGAALVAVSGASTALLYSSVKLAARVETLGVVTTTLGRNVGKTEKEIRDLEKAIVDQGITLRGARTAIALMIQSNIDLSNAVDLAAEAQNAAVIAGINSTEAFEQLVYTITSGNVRMARTLGLQVSFQGAYEKTAEAVGKTTSELTEQEKVQARTQEVIRAGVNILGAYDAAMETAGKQVTSLDRYVEESKRMLGEAWLPTYAKVIQFVTNSLKSWLELSDTKKAVISTTLGMMTAFVGIVGVLSLVASKVSAAITGFTSLATAVAGSGTVVFSANMVLGIYIASLAALAAAIYMVIKTVNLYKAGLAKVNDAYEEHRKHMLKVADSYEEYRAEMIRSGLLVAEAKLGHHRFTQILKFEGEEAVLAAAGINLESEALFHSGQAAERGADVTNRMNYELGLLGNKMLEASGNANIFSRSQEELQADLDLLNKTIDLDITTQFEDYTSKVKELTAKIEELESKEYLTSAQREDLENTRKELEETKRQWDLTTARIIFDLAEQRLAIDGLTEEENAALRELAGPEGLGLIDQAAVELLEQIDLLAGEMDIFAEQAVALQGPLTDAAGEARGLASAIQSVKSKSVTVTITTVKKTVYKAAASSSSTHYGGYQTGTQFAQAGKAAIVGERGPEIMVPRRSGMVLNNRFLNAINTLVSALKAAPMLSAPSATAVSSVNNNQQYNYNLNIATQSPVEPIVGDFRAMQAMSV